MRFGFGGIAALALAFAALPAFADLEARTELGYGGRWVIDAVTPLRVQLANSGAEPLLVQIVVTQGEAFTFGDVVHRRVVAIEPGARREDVFLIPGPQLYGGGAHVELKVDPAVPIHSPDRVGERGELTIDVSSGGGPFGNDHITYAARVVGVVGDVRGTVAARLAALGLSSPDQRDGRSSQRIEAVNVVPELLRLAPLCLDGIDTLLLCDPDAASCAEPAAMDGVLDWVALGGTLVVSLGEHAGQFAGSPLAPEMPANWTGSVRTRYDALLADLGIETSNDEAPGPWVVLRPNASSDAIDAALHDGSPVRAERRLGMGRIVVLPFDMRLAVSDVTLNAGTARTLLSPVVVADVATPQSDENRWVQSDFGTQIARTLQAGAFEAPPLLLVVFGVLLYVVVVGPLDWVVLKRLKKQRLTTFTFLGSVATFTVLAYGASFFLFSAGARVNRVVLADLADAGRDGRQAFAFTDIAGYYSPTGSDQDIAYAAPAVVMPAPLPGFGVRVNSGAGSPVQVMGNDPLRPKAAALLAFRSQQAVRALSSGTLGSTIDVEWKDGGVRVVNGLSVDLDDVAVYVGDREAYSLGAVKSGDTSNGGAFEMSKGRRDSATERQTHDRGFGDWGDLPSPTRTEVRAFLELASVGPDASANAAMQYGRDQRSSMRKARIERSGAFARGRALLVAHASKFPGVLPGDGTDGDTYVVFRKEVKLP